jgi:hypothetical protein
MLGNYFLRSVQHKQIVNKGKSFLAFVNKRQNIEAKCAAITGGQGKLIYFIYFSWPLVEELQSIFNFRLLATNKFA